MKKKYKTPVFISEIIKEEQYLLAASGGGEVPTSLIDETPDGNEATDIIKYQL